MTALRILIAMLVVLSTLVGCAPRPDVEMADEAPPKPRRPEPTTYRVADYRFRSTALLTKPQADALAAILKQRVDPNDLRTSSVQFPNRRTVLISVLQIDSEEAPPEASMRFLCETRGELALRLLTPVSQETLGAYAAAVQRLQTRGPSAGVSDVWLPIRSTGLFDLPTDEDVTLVAMTRVSLELGVALAQVDGRWYALADTTNALTLDSQPPWKVHEAYVSHIADGWPVLVLRLDVGGVHRLRELCDRRRGQRLGVFVDGELLGAPLIGDETPNPIEFACDISKLEAQVWARILAAPPLPVRLQFDGVSTRPVQ